VVQDFLRRDGNGQVSHEGTKSTKNRARWNEDADEASDTARDAPGAVTTAGEAERRSAGEDSTAGPERTTVACAVQHPTKSADLRAWTAKHKTPITQNCRDSWRGYPVHVTNWRDRRLITTTGGSWMALLTAAARVLPLLVLTSCSVAAGGTNGPGLAIEPGQEPAAIIEALEARLLSEPVRLRYRVTSSGAFAAELDGILDLSDHSSQLSASGTFGDSPVSLHLAAGSDSMRIESPQGARSEPTPPQLRQSLAIGLVRMGVLHNLARLTGGLAPDHADGGVREWVELREIRADTADAPHTEWLGLRFDIHVSGTRTAEATLWIHRTTGLPMRREQVVRFPGGSMSVVEEYDGGWERSRSALAAGKRVAAGTPR
jgi:hypothetical protein